MYACRNSFTLLTFVYAADYYFSDTPLPTSNNPQADDQPSVNQEIDSFSEWSTWTACPVSCGVGRHLRERECLTRGKIQVNCIGALRDLASCNTQPCPGIERAYMYVLCRRGCYPKYICIASFTILLYLSVNGGWSNWTDWTECSLTCDPGGVQTRERNCSNPMPAFGGNDCVGDSVETKQCNKRPCPGN